MDIITRHRYEQDIIYLSGGKPKNLPEFIGFLFAGCYNAIRYDTPEKARREVESRKRSLEEKLPETPITEN
jgi:hypothetical protein